MRGNRWISSLDREVAPHSSLSMGLKQLPAASGHLSLSFACLHLHTLKCDTALHINVLPHLKKGLRKFLRAENFQIGVSAEAWRGSLHPSLPPSLTALPSLLCTGVWSCFLMSSGTTGAIALSPSVVTFCTCYKAFIDPVCIHTFTRTKFMLI